MPIPELKSNQASLNMRVTGFVGSDWLEQLLSSEENIVGLESFAIGHQKNLDEAKGIAAQ